MSCFLLDIIVFYYSFLFYADLVRNTVALDYIRGPNAKFEIPIILVANFGRNAPVKLHDVKNDMYREKIELSEYQIRFAA